jgi:translation initiation factor 4A
METTQLNETWDEHEHEHSIQIIHEDDKTKNTPETWGDETKAPLPMPEVKVDSIKTIESWDELDLDMSLLRGIYANGFENPSQIQKTAIIPIIEKRDLIAQAPSGTGKTGAFTVGTLQRINLECRTTQALIMAPTHELVRQIAKVVSTIGNMMDGLVVKTLVGGTSVSDDAADLRTNVPHIVIGSVGRVSDMIRRNYIRTNNIKIFVLDEADEMLSGGFLENIYNMFHSFNTNIQVAVFSATMPSEMLQLTNKFMRDPVKITLNADKLNLDGIKQYYIALQNDQSKYDTLKDLFGQLSINQTIVYVNSVNRVIDLYESMRNDNHSVCCIHSSMHTDERKKALSEFRAGAYRILISSNVTARGIDVQQVSVVINFDVPKCVHNYLHRIGRSGRWGRKGLAINFVTKDDISSIRAIETHYDSKIEELPINFSELV